MRVDEKISKKAQTKRVKSFKEQRKTQRKFKQAMFVLTYGDSEE